MAGKKKTIEQSNDIIDNDIIENNNPMNEQVEQPVQRRRIKDVELERRYTPLRAEIINVRFVEESDGYITDKKHPLFGGLSTNGRIKLVVPRLRNGALKDILTKDEMRFFEDEYYRLEQGTMSAVRRVNNYWNSDTEGVVNFVNLTKEGLQLNLENGDDYIRYKILLANNDIVASSMDELRNNRKPTHKFVMVSESSEDMYAGEKSKLIAECFAKLTEYWDDNYTLRMALRIRHGKMLGSNTKIEKIRNGISEMILDDPFSAHKILTDKLLYAKGLIQKYFEYGIVSNRGGFYYIKEDGQPMSFENEEPRLSEAAEFIVSKEAIDIRERLDKLVKEFKN